MRSPVARDSVMLWGMEMARLAERKDLERSMPHGVHLGLVVGETIVYCRIQNMLS